MNEEQLKELLKDAWDGGVEYYKDICHNSIIPPITFTEWYADTKQKLNIHSVMQAEGSGVSKGATVGQRSAGKKRVGGIKKCTCTRILQWVNCTERCDRN